MVLCTKVAMTTMTMRKTTVMEMREESRRRGKRRKNTTQRKGRSG